MTKEDMMNEDCGCGCGCGHDDHDHEHEEEIMHLTLDDGTELDCVVIGVFEVEDKEYIALMPVGEEDAFLYEYKEIEDEFELLAIEDEDEFNAVSDAFYALFVDEEDLEEYTTYDELED